VVHLGKKQVEAGVNRVGGSANPVGESMGGGEHKGDAKHKGTAGATVVVVPRSPYSWMPYWGRKFALIGLINGVPKLCPK